MNTQRHKGTKEDEQVIDFAGLTVLGCGGEATVYALDEGRVVRVFKAGTGWESVRQRTRFLERVAAGSGHLRFEVPIVIEEGEVEEGITQRREGTKEEKDAGGFYTIEKRIAGRSMQDALKTVEGEERERLIVHYLETAWAIGEIVYEADGFGEIGLVDGLMTDNWREWLSARARRSLRGTRWEGFDVDGVVGRLPVCERGRFVHLDYFPGNAMAVGDRVTAVIDFGYACVLGDVRLAPIWAAAYLTLGRTAEVAQPDMDVAMAWLDGQGLMQWYEGAVQWLALYWMMVPPEDDPVCREWCESVLGVIG